MILARIKEESEHKSGEFFVFTKPALGLFIASGLFFRFYKIRGKKYNGFHVATVITN